MTYKTKGKVLCVTFSQFHTDTKKPPPSVSDKTYFCQALHIADVKSFPTSPSLLKSDMKWWNDNVYSYYVHL